MHRRGVRQCALVTEIPQHVLHGRLRRARTIVRAGLISLLLFAALFSFAPGTAHADAGRISVTVNNVTNFACVDQFIFCGKPDIMVRTEVRQDNGQIVSCPDTTPEANFNVVGPLTTCSAEPISVPADLIITVYDVDEKQLPQTVRSRVKYISAIPAAASRCLFSPEWHTTVNHGGISGDRDRDCVRRADTTKVRISRSSIYLAQRLILNWGIAPWPATGLY